MAVPFGRRELVQLAVSAGVGVVFGFTLEKSQVANPAIIWNQMLFLKFTMLKVFFSAVISGMAVFGILQLIPGTRDRFDSVRRNFVSCLTSRTTLTVAIGGVLFGIGLTLAGTCPGIVFVQLGMGAKNAVYALAGGVAGVLAYGLIDSIVAKPARYHKVEEYMIDKSVGVPYLGMILPAIVLFGSLIAIIESVRPWSSEVPTSAGNIFVRTSWSPIASGLLVGSLQLPLALSVGDSLGYSSAYCTLLAQPLNAAKLLRTRAFSYFQGFLSGLTNWWQVTYILGTIVGGMASSVLSGTWGSTTVVSATSAFVGGFCLLFGSRMAAGCTSGHGLSGIALLSTLSLVAVPAMFAGGMSVAFALSYLQN